MIKKLSNEKVPIHPIANCHFLFFITEMAVANSGFTFGMVSKVIHISKKLTIIEVTIMSIPKKKSPAKCEPSTPMLAIKPANNSATCGVCFFSCTFERALF